MVSIGGEDLHLEVILCIVEKVLSWVMESDIFSVPTDLATSLASKRLSGVDFAKISESLVDPLVRAIE